ncbi:hypothetical protein D3C81_898090 [compost metagenome]
MAIASARVARLHYNSGPEFKGRQNNVPRLRSRLRHLQLHGWLAAPPPAGAVAAGRWQDHAAVGDLLPRRGPAGQLRARRAGRLPGRLRGPADALAQEPARHVDDGRQHRGHGPGHALPPAAGPFHRRTETPRRTGRRHHVHQGGAGPAGVLYRRRPQGRPVGRGHAGRDCPRGGLPGHRVPVRADCCRVRLRSGHLGRGTGDGGRHRRRYLRLFAGAAVAGPRQEA